MTKIRSAVAILIMTIVLALGGSVATAPPAQAAGSVANSCAVTANVLVSKKIPTGINLYNIPCGQGTSNVYWATVTKHPFFVKLPGTAPRCYQAGALFYPNNSGGGNTAVITPTVRCR